MKMIKLTAVMVLLLSASSGWADSNNSSTIWLQQFNNIQPINTDTTQAYCNSHIPKSFKATISKLTNDGINVTDNMTVLYSSYKGVSYDNLYFTFVVMKLKGHDQNGSWSDKMKLYQQGLSATSSTSGVWSTSKCHGTFAGQIVGQASS